MSIFRRLLTTNTASQSVSSSSFRLVGHGSIVRPTDSLALEVRTPERDVVESVQVSVDVFKAPLRTDILHRSTKHYLASLRQGTASAKTRAEVRGGGRKPHKQKGTGWARAGSIRSPLWRGGGVVFPPKPRDFSFDLPKKVRRYALRSALSVKLAQNRLDVWIELDIGTHRTAVLAELIRRHGWRSVLFVSEAPEVKETSDFARAAANLPLVEFVSVHKLTVYDVLKYERLVLSRDAALALDAYLKPQRLLGVIGAQPTPAPAPSQTEVQMN